MDFTVMSEFKSGAITFKSKALTKSTEKLIKNMNKSKEAFCAAAAELKTIRDDKLFAEDFKDAKGKPNFNNYCEEVLGISKSKANRIIVTGTRLLMPELVTKEHGEYFVNFGDTNLSLIAEAGDNYDECIQFCIDYEIDETTPQKDVRAAVKEYRAYKNGTIEAEAIGDETETTGDEVETTGDEVETDSVKETVPNLKLLVGEMFREDINGLIEMFPNYVDVIKQVAKEWK